MSQILTGEPELSVGTDYHRNLGEGSDVNSGIEGDIPQPAESAAGLKGRAEHVAHAAAQKGRDVAGYVSNKAEDATNSVAAGLKSLGETVRDKVPESAATNAVADTLEHTGQYLQEEGITGAAHDLTALIRRNPIPAMLIGIGFGFLIAQATSSKRS